MGVIIITKVKKKIKTKLEKKIKTPFGEIKDTTEDKENIFGEQCRTDDQKEKDAQRALHARLSQDDREKAYKWVAYYKALLDEDDGP